MEEAAVAAAYKVAEAENKSFVAAEAVKEAERVSKMAEDADSFLQLAKDIYDRCNDKNARFMFLFIFSLCVITYSDSLVSQVHVVKL